MKKFIIRLIKKLEYRLTGFNRDEVIYNLWKLLDEIDTASDIAKYDDKFYRSRVEYLQRRRFFINIQDDYIDKLYDEYYPHI